MYQKSSSSTVSDSLLSWIFVQHSCAWSSSLHLSPPPQSPQRVNDATISLGCSGSGPDRLYALDDHVRAGKLPWGAWIHAGRHSQVTLLRNSLESAKNVEANPCAVLQCSRPNRMNLRWRVGNHPRDPMRTGSGVRRPTCGTHQGREGLVFLGNHQNCCWVEWIGHVFLVKEKQNIQSYNIIKLKHIYIAVTRKSHGCIF